MADDAKYPDGGSWWRGPFSWKNIVSAAPELILSASFLSYLYLDEPILGWSKRTLTDVMKIEFIVIHAGAFLGWVGLYNPKTFRGKVFQWVCFFSLLAMYTFFASQAGWAGIALFFGLTFTTYFGLILNWHDVNAQIRLGARWIVCFIAFFAGPGFFDTPENVGSWGGKLSVIKAGAAYFAILGLVELSGFYQVHWLSEEYFEIED